MAGAVLKEERRHPMKLRFTKAIVATGVILSAFTWVVAGQTQNGDESSMIPQAPQGMTAGQGMMGMHNGSGMMGNTGMMKAWGMTPQMLAQGRMMSHAQVSRNDPATLLGLAGQLKLTDEQKARLEAIDSKAQAEALSVLNADQKERVNELPDSSGSIAAMFAMMQAHRQQMHGSAGNNPCPMIQMMATMPTIGGGHMQSDN